MNHHFSLFIMTSSCVRWYYSLPSFTFSKQDTSTSSSNNKTYLPKASTSCNITPPMCKSPRTRSVFSTCKSVTETFKSHEPSTIWPSLIILKFGVCTSIIEDNLSTNTCVFAGCVFQCHFGQPTLHTSRVGGLGEALVGRRRTDCRVHDRRRSGNKHGRRSRSKPHTNNSRDYILLHVSSSQGHDFERQLVYTPM